jgi:hypothetical protein
MGFLCFVVDCFLVYSYCSCSLDPDYTAILACSTWLVVIFAGSDNIVRNVEQKSTWQRCIKHKWYWRSNAIGEKTVHLSEMI